MILIFAAMLTLSDFCHTETGAADKTDPCADMDYHGAPILLTEDEISQQLLAGDDGSCMAFHMWMLEIIKKNDAIVCFDDSIYWVPFTEKCITCEQAAELAIGY